MVPTSEAQLPKDYLDQSMMAPPGRTHRYFTGTPLYPFGFGLGYSSFRYSDLAVSHRSLASGNGALDQVVSVSVRVTNNGEYEAGSSDEVVMAFAVPRLAATVAPSVPRQILLGFSRVTLAPGRTATAHIRVPAKRLRIVGADDAYELQRGSYEIRVGGSGALYGTAEPLREALRVD